MSEFKKVLNPFVAERADDYNCFGCSPRNPSGLSLEFYSDGERLFADWEPVKQFEGYRNVIHGGIQATLMDEIASWTIYALLDTAGVTQKMDIEYKRPLYISGGKVILKSEIKDRNDNSVMLYVEILNSNNIVCSCAEVSYYLFPPKIARLKYHYPGKEAFWV